MPKKRRDRKRTGRTLDARPDPIDFRDRMYVATLVEVPIRRPLAAYRELQVPILDQGQEGACTGFGLATVANYLLRSRRVYPDAKPVSARMFYEMAKRYDEWPGTDYSGSSARGAMKGWHKHGVCADTLWPYVPKTMVEPLTHDRAADASGRPLGAYLRVNHRDIVGMHAAITEAGILYATAQVHSGWGAVDPATGIIPLEREIQGGHAFAVVAYDEQGFWIQNSWGEGWGHGGFARVSYDDWLKNATDVWVARLGVPVHLERPESQAIARSELASRTEVLSQADLRPHVVSLGNDGRLNTSGPFGTSPEHLKEIFTRDFPRVTASWKRKRLLLYAHGGLVSEQSAVQRVADYREALLKAEVYPVSFVWKTDYWTTLTNMLRDAVSRRRPEGFVDDAKDFLLDRLDDGLEQIARLLTGKSSWDEMKENALLATADKQGGFSLAAPHIRDLAKNGVEIHAAGHSAGSIFMALPVQLLTGRGALKGHLKGRTGLGLNLASCTLWAPAITTALFKECYLPAIGAGAVERFTLFTLTDQAEQDDDCAGIYHKSLLYLVSNAFEERAHIPLPGRMRQPGTPLLGMARCIEADPELKKLLRPGVNWILSPNTTAEGSAAAARAQRHGAFDDDKPTVRATLARILGLSKVADEAVPLRFQSSASSCRDTRREVTGASLVVR
jgi:hypothetical protein